MIDLLYKFDRANMPDMEEKFYEEAQKKFSFNEMEGLGEEEQLKVI